MTEEQYQNMMAKLQRSGKISGSYGDIPVEKNELLRRVVAAKNSGLVKNVKPLEVDPDIEQNFSMDEHDRYIGDRPQVDKNTKELLAIGIPQEVLAPFIQRKNEESVMMRNLNRRYAAKPGGDENTLVSSKANPEERQLGLDPSKYTNKQWSPQNYFGWSDGKAPMNQVVDDMKSDAGLATSQKKVLGDGGAKSESEAYNAALRNRLMMKSMGLDPMDELPDSFSPTSKDAIRSLGWDVEAGENGSTPVVPKEDEKTLLKLLNSDMEESQMTPRERLIMDAMTNWKNKNKPGDTKFWRKEGVADE